MAVLPDIGATASASPMGSMNSLQGRNLQVQTVWKELATYTQPIETRYCQSTIQTPRIKEKCGYI